MALILLDGMEDATSIIGGGGFSTGRLGVGRCLQVGGNEAAFFFIPPVHESNTVTLGFARSTGIFSMAGNADVFLRLCSDNVTTNHLVFYISNVGTVSLYLGSTGGTLLATSPIGVMPLANYWYYVEVQANLHDSTGFAKMRVNGVEVINYTGDTRNGGTKNVFDSINFYGTTGSAWYADDFYLMTGAGDNFLGDVVIETLYPNNNGSANQWTGSDGNAVDNYLLVDDPGTTAFNTMVTDYVFTGTAGQQDMYQMTNLVRTQGSVVGVCHTALVTKSDATTKPIKLVNRGGTDTKSGNQEPIMGTWRNIHYTLAVNPETGAPFTIAEVNALQSGVESG